MKVSIIGAGCVGSVFAKLLYESNCANVTLIAKEHFAHNLKKNGVKVNGKKYNIPLLAETDPKPDLLIVCVKNYDLKNAMLDMKKFIDKHTIILPMLNSISPTSTIQENFPQNRVLYGYISKIDSSFNNGEYIYNIAGDVHFGYAKNESIAPELKEIQSLFSEIGFNATVDEDMIRGVWKKWMLNVGANQVSALTEANYLQFAKIPEIEEILRLAMMELLSIACYEGVSLSTNDVSEIVEYLTTYKFPKKTSMLQDVLAKRETEVDYISGDIIRLSNKWNCPCPVNLTMYYLIKSKQSAYLM